MLDLSDSMLNCVLVVGVLDLSDSMLAACLWWGMLHLSASMSEDVLIVGGVGSD